jgi:hypothetical protein
MSNGADVRTLALRTAVAAAIVWTFCAGTVRAQSLATEATMSTGASTERLAAGAAQVRAFGELAAGLRFFAEAAWGARSESGTDAFGSAYPYANRVQAIEAYVERIFRPRGAIVGVRGGRYRAPFGISAGSDHGYIGFLRAPLMRYDGYFAISNNFLEHGGSALVGMPRATFEAHVGRPADVGSATRRGGTTAVLRLQGSVGALNLGASRIETSPYLPETFARGRTVFTGLDVRWMHAGVQLRGEWLAGRPFDGTSTSGWYADAIVHRPGLGPVTVVARIERLDYDTSRAQSAIHASRQTAGVRIRFLRGFSAQINVLRQSGQLPTGRSGALDAGLTYSLRQHIRD